MGLLTERGPLYWGLMAALGGLCLAGLALFFRCFRQRLLGAMFDTGAWYWNGLWGGFSALGGVCLAFGLALLRERRRA